MMTEAQVRDEIKAVKAEIREAHSRKAPASEIMGKYIYLESLEFVANYEDEE